MAPHEKDRLIFLAALALAVLIVGVALIPIALAVGQVAARAILKGG